MLHRVFLFSILFISFIFMLYAFTTETPYNLPDFSFFQEEDVTELYGISQREQGNAGHCFAFSTASALDYFVCNKMDNAGAFRDDCFNEMPIFSTLQLSSFIHGKQKKEIAEGRNPLTIIRTIQNQNPGLIREECAPYENYLTFIINFREYDGRTDFQLAQEAYNQDKINNSGSCSIDFAGHIYDYGSFSDINDIVNFSRKHSFGEILHEAFIPEWCRGSSNDKLGNIIDFNHKDIRNFKNNKKVYRFIQDKLDDNTPLIFNFDASTPNSSGAHSALITGIKKVCDGNQCKTLFKIQNSYGYDWQDRYSDGWVLADPLIERSRNIHPSFTWISEK